MTCLITGCGIYILGEEIALWGDLFEMGSVYILNGVVGKDGSAWLLYHRTLPDVLASSDKMVILRGGAKYFERRGVVVVEKAHTTFNETARNYLKC